MKTYNSYKDSGIEWIGEIPSHWEVKKLKQISEIVLGKMLHSEDKGSMNLKPYLRAANLNWLKVDVSDLKEMWFSEYELKKLRLKKGDLLVSEGGEVGRTCIWENEIDECYIQNSVHKITVDQNSNSKFFLFHFFSFGMRGVFDYLVNRISIAHLTVEKIREISFCFPPLGEQSAIASYLDRKTAEIDDLIADKKRLLELYEEEKSAVINQAVTKGINPNTPMKDSRIEWLGEIPEHWKVKKLKMIVTKIGSGVTPSGGSSVYLREGIPLLRSQNIHFNGLKLEDVAYISEEIDQSMSNSRIKEDDILLNITGASIGRCFYVPKDFGKGNVNQHVCIIRPILDVINPIYLYFLIRSLVGQVQIDLQQTGANREGLNFEQLKNFILPIPPSIPEQEAIVQIVRKTIKKIETNISKTQKLIDLLTEYRTALISDVVTGKVKVID